MPNLTCPEPYSTNTLSPTGFKFSVSKLPELSYFCQTASLPSLSLGSAQQANPFVDINHPGDKLTFAPLSIRFIIDEEMNNFMGIYNWMKGLGFPTNNTEYTQFLAEQQANLTESAKAFSDGTLAILGTNYVTVRTFRFVDLFPTAIQTLDFDSTLTSIEPLLGQVEFSYSYYEIM